MTKLEELASERAAVVTMELQRGVVGDLSAMKPLVKSVADAKLIENTARVLEAARAHGVPVVHCTAAFRRDRVGSYRNVPLINRLLDNPNHLVEGSAEVELVPALGPEPSDIVSQRMHGISPFHGTSLDPVLRSLGVATVIATGVSLNVGIIGLTIEAINRGYHVVLATDCVCGHPPEYGEAVIESSLAQLTTQTTSDELVALWER